MKFLDLDKLKLLADNNKALYASAVPFPHAVFDNLFDSNQLLEVASEFPSMRSKMIDKPKPASKRKLSFRTQNKALAPMTKDFCDELNSKEFLTFLETLTGIDNLVADPYLEGGGPHEISRGGFLKMHVDFNVHPITKFDRRINVLVYLNENWQEDYLGHLDLWTTDMSELNKKILPVLNRTVIFNTTEESWHGHPDPLNCPKDITRKSIAMYYYTDTKMNESNKHSTIYKKRFTKDF